jgi:large conductance mechanosensitive channel
VLQEFKRFLARGNVIDLAVAVVIGAAFTTVINAIVDNLISPILGLLGGADLSDLVITLRSESATDPAIVLGYGAIVTALINLLLVAAAVFFLIVKPINAMAERRRRGEEAPEDTPAPSDEALLLTEIRDVLKAQRAG